MKKLVLWGAITNTNLQILQQAASGYLSLAMTGNADITVALTDGAVSNGKNLYFKLTGTLARNQTLIMPSGAERSFYYRRCNNAELQQQIYFKC